MGHKREHEEVKSAQETLKLAREVIRRLDEIVRILKSRARRPSITITIHARNQPMPTPSTGPFDLTTTPANAEAAYSDGLGGIGAGSIPTGQSPVWAIDNPIALITPDPNDILGVKLDAIPANVPAGTTATATLTCTVGPTVGSALVSVSVGVGPTPSITITITPR